MVEDFAIPSKLEFCILKENTFTTLYFLLHLQMVTSHYTPCYYFLIIGHSCNNASCYFSNIMMFSLKEAKLLVVTELL